MPGNTRRWLYTAFVMSLLVGDRGADAAPFQDLLVQAPSIGTPQRGSLAGSLSKLALGPGDLARGTFSLPLPISVPTDRGPLLAKVVPSYSPEAGITEWGMGWQSDLKIQRYKPHGEVDFVTDELTSPWGRLVPGDNGSFYPLGLTSMVRVTAQAGGWIAQTSDGTRYRFDAADSVTTSQGTFAWMLSRVDTIFGDSTSLSWRRDPGGRLYLSTVHWGGKYDGTQYRMSFEYESVEEPFFTYLSGVKQQLDQRVRSVSVNVKQGGGYAVRWRYDLTYSTGPTGLAYYLRQLTRTYATGASDPPVKYDYDLNTELWASTQLTLTPALDALIAANGGNVIQPDRASVLDLEEDGLLDIELAFDHTTVHQTATGFTFEALPPAQGATDPACRPMPSDFNRPRRLARMHGSAAEPHAIAFEKVGFGEATRLLICSRLGEPIYDQEVAGDWELDANVRLADVDLDKRPDVVRVGFGEVTVLKNTSSDPAHLAFEPGATTLLSPEVNPIASWIRDINGDGRADLMVKHSNGVFAWFGVGHGQFDPEGQAYEFITASGWELPGVAGYQFSHGDFNGDGMSDLLLTQAQSVFVFINTGNRFVETDVPGLRELPFTVTFPVIADLAGTGDELAMFVDGDHALALQLTSPSTGLLRSADDGKGTVVRFGYGRAFGYPGIVHRYATLAELAIESSGYDAVAYRYDYANPVLHSRGKYLMGFGGVTKHSPILTELMTFRNSDDFSGVRDATEDTDERSPGIIRFTRRQYEDVRVHGIRMLRLSSTESGHRTLDGNFQLSTVTRTLSYQRGVCPTSTVTTGPDYELTKTMWLADVSGIPSDLHCLSGSQLIVGTHANPALDFSYLAGVARNAGGQVTSLTQYGPSMQQFVLQEIAYNANHQIVAIGSPGHGTNTITYDSLGRAATLTDPAGVTLVVTNDSLSDALVALQTARPDALFTASYRYDDHERLAASWDDISGGTAQQPLLRYAYRDATNTAPGRIDTWTLADSLTGATDHSLDLVAADGATLVSGKNLGARVAMGRSEIELRGELSKRTSQIGSLTHAAVDSLTSAGLRGLGVPIATSLQAGFGYASDTTTTYQAGVVGNELVELLLAGDELIKRVRTTGGIVAESAVDAAGRVVRRTDENGVVHRYAYDALGRVVLVETPDGDHTLTLDGFGRPSRVVREGVGAVGFGYDPVSGLLVRKQRFDAGGNLVDTTDTSYDSIGRQVAAAQTRAGATTDLAFDYDGQRGNESVGGQLGRLTRVQGPGWERSQLFDPLGRIFETRTTLDGWREVTSDKSYYANGTPASETLSIADENGQARLSVTKEIVLDNRGRAAGLRVNGATLYTLVYDDENRVERADFGAGRAIVFEYDSVTRKRRGYRVIEGSQSGIQWERNARGLIEAETYVVNGVSTRRAYSYDNRGALVRAQTPARVDTYTYTASGLPETVDDIAGARQVHRAGQTLEVGGVMYTWDSAGRVVGKGPWSFVYGGNGQITSASRTGTQIDFLYDENNQRLMKRVNGVPVRAEVAGGILTDDHFVELVTVEGIVVGILDNAAFTLLATDPRGTPFAGAGTSGIASAYGMRASHSDISELIDYTRLGWDPDLGIVRMGVRDYDPSLGQFWTPDPKFFESIEDCARDTLQCSLYGYAVGNPLSFTDPTGLDVFSFYNEEVKPVVDVVLSGLRFMSGLTLAVAGTALCTSGVGCAIGAAMFVYGMSVAANGAEKMLTGNAGKHVVNQAIAGVTSQEVADDFDSAVTAVRIGTSVSKKVFDFAGRLGSRASTGAGSTGSGPSGSGPGPSGSGPSGSGPSGGPAGSPKFLNSPPSAAKLSGTVQTSAFGTAGVPAAASSALRPASMSTSAGGAAFRSQLGANMGPAFSGPSAWPQPSTPGSMIPNPLHW